MSQPDYPEQQNPEYEQCKQCEGIVHIVKYTLPQHQEDLDVHLRAWKYRGALDDLQQWIRSLDKYSDIETITVEELKAKFADIIDTNEAWLF